MNKMNDSLQAELQVSGSVRAPELPATSLPVSFTLHPSVCEQKTCRDVEESERLVEVLQAEVSALRTRLRERQQSESGKGFRLFYLISHSSGIR